MKKIILLLAVFSFWSHAIAQPGEETAIRDIIEKQRLDWNRGNIDAFMEGYWKSDSLMFIGANGITYGWEKTLSNYKRRYPDTAAMGKLDFTILQVKELPEACFFIVGRWHLTRSIGNVGGHFTLLFRKINNKWVIVADHTS